MNITLEAVEKVIELTGAELKDAKEALAKADGDVDAAVKLIKPDKEEAADTKDTEASKETTETNNTADEKAAEEKSTTDDIQAAIDKLKKKVAEGNVDKIQIRKGDEVVFSVPVNVGIIGGLIGLAAAPWAVIAAAVAAFGFGCRLEVVKKDGSTDEVE